MVCTMGDRGVISRTMKNTHLWLRAETKPLEQRTALTPSGASTLLDARFQVTIEDSAQSIFSTEEYRPLGCDIVAPESWREAPREAFILGLKELPEDSFPLEHRHIYFAHVFKRQAGADSVLRRYVEGGGALYDLEYLTHADGRRVAAFGYWAGFSGAAIGIQAWANKAAGGSQILDQIASLPSKDDLVDKVSAALAKTPKRPTVMVIGAKGRSGCGAIDLAKAVGLETVEWDIDETRAGGPFTEIIEADVFVNCVLVNRRIPPFVTKEMLAREDRRLAVIVDVSCDPYGPFNPLPVYDRCTSFEEPSLRLQGGPRPLDLVAIDNLPSMLPRESSEDFGDQLVPCLALLDDPGTGIWQRAYDIFVEQTQSLR